MKIFDLKGRRFEVALEMLKEGDYIIYDNIGFQIKGNKADIYIWTDYLYLENITKNIAIEELNNGKFKLLDILKKSKELSEILNDKELFFSVRNDEGQYGTIICEEINGNLKWILKDLR